MPDLDATWLYGEIETKDGRRPVLNIFYATDSLQMSFDICRVASKVATKYKIDKDILLSTDCGRAHIALHLYEPGGLANEHFAAAWEIAEAVRSSNR